MVALSLAVIAVVPVPGETGDPVTIGALLANPTPWADREVLVDGIAGQSRWANLTVLGNPPVQGWYQMFLLTDGQSALWVVIKATGIGASPLAAGAPPPGSRIQVGGVFRAGTRAIEMDRPILYR